MEFDTYLRFLLALVAVLGLIAAMTWAARRLGLGNGLGPLKGRTTRLSVVESLTLDAKRRLVLVRRDDREHLLVLGPTEETVVEAGIPARALSSVPTKSSVPTISAIAASSERQAS